MSRINPKTIERELQRRTAVAASFKESPFPQQDAFVQDTARFLDAQCSRRAGKTNALGRRFFQTMSKYPNSQSVYLALTKDSALEIMMPVLIELNDKYAWNCKFTKLTMTHPNGAQLKLYGADMKNFIRKLKGRKYPGIAIDEAQDFGVHLKSLIDDVLSPAMVDYEDSWLAITGTPGPVPLGYYFEVTHQKKYGFSHHEWTINDNPYIHDAEKFIQKLKHDHQWEDNNPTLLREWRNKWVKDVESLWIRYNESKNHFNAIPPGKWTYIMGVDFGYKDADAIAVLAWNEESKKTYLVEEVVQAKQDITALVEQIQKLTKKYDIVKIVADEGALGKKMAEEMRRRHHIPVHAAEKHRKQETVAFLNDTLRLGDFLADRESRFVQDSYLIQIDWERTTPDKIVIKKNPHSDIIDAVLYAFKESPAFTYERPAAKLTKGTPEYYDKEEEDMFQLSLEKALEEADAEKEEDPFGY